MSEAAQLDGPGVLPGLRRALRSMQSTDAASVWQAVDGDLGEALALIGQIRQLTDVAEVAVAREGIGRGLPTEEAWSAHDWVSVSEGRRAPRPGISHVASVVRVAQADDLSGLSAAPALSGAEEGEGVGLALAVGAFARGEMPLGKADQLVRFHESVRRIADPDLLDADLLHLTDGASDDVIAGPDGGEKGRAHGLDEKKLGAAITMTARMLRPEKGLKDEDERQKASRSLTKSAGPCGMTRYKVLLDPEGAAVVDAALATLSAPVKGPNGERDERSPARRNADALVAIVGRGVSSPGDAPKTDKAQVLVTISLQALLGDLGLQDPLATCRGPGAFGRGVGGHAGGVTATGEVLAPSAVRKMACEGGIIPVVLGGEGEILDMGRSTRFFTPAQKKALWLRDQGCTFPECTMPAQWTDAHHLDWWSRGGRTDLDRAALLCERHHTTVHQRDLDATVSAAGVTWHL